MRTSRFWIILSFTIGLVACSQDVEQPGLTTSGEQPIASQFNRSRRAQILPIALEFKFDYVPSAYLDIEADVINFAAQNGFTIGYTNEQRRLGDSMTLYLDGTYKTGRDGITISFTEYNWASIWFKDYGFKDCEQLSVFMVKFYEAILESNGMTWRRILHDIREYTQSDTGPIYHQPVCQNNSSVIRVMKEIETDTRD